MAKTPGDDDSGHRPGKHMKVGKKGAGRSMLSVEKNIVPASQGPVKNIEEMKIQGQVNASATFHQHLGGDSKSLLDLSQPLRSSNGDASLYLADSSEKQKTGLLSAKNHSSKLKEASKFTYYSHVNIMIEVNICVNFYLLNRTIQRSLK